ncbi:hypothetical protein LguiA_029248 [Lonicera macranthoides]
MGRSLKSNFQICINPAPSVNELESLQFDLGTIQAARNNFSDENKIREGGFGMVYKGTLADGQEIVVKRLSKTSGQGAQEFNNEVVSYQASTQKPCEAFGFLP